jgi:hypothetical protein
MDLIICVFGCDTIEKYRNEILKINETWGSTFVKILFFLGEEEYLQGENYIHLKDVKNDYLSASYKQFLGLKYIYENYKPKFVFVCGTDTYININKLLKYIEQFNSNSNLYIGGHGCKRQVKEKYLYFHSGGAGFILSFGCLSKLYPLLNNAVEKWLEICPQHLIYACDVAISYYLQELDTTVLIDNDSFWNCNYKGMVGSYSCHSNINIQKIITCHNMSLSDFDEFSSYLN